MEVAAAAILGQGAPLANTFGKLEVDSDAECSAVQCLSARSGCSSAARRDRQWEADVLAMQSLVVGMLVRRRASYPSVPGIIQELLVGDCKWSGRCRVTWPCGSSAFWRASQLEVVLEPEVFERFFGQDAAVYGGSGGTGSTAEVENLLEVLTAMPSMGMDRLPGRQRK